MSTGDIKTTKEKQRIIRVAAVQSQSKLGMIDANLKHFTPMVEQAAEQGAQLIVFPELAASGYSMSKLVWDAAESRDGATLTWMKQISLRLGVYIGIGFVEAEGEDFFNTFAISAPDGRICGFVRKTMAETSCFRCSEGPHVIETEIGRIGVGICADNLFVDNLDRMQDNDADILLMPHAAPIPYKTGRLVSEKDIPEARQSMGLMATDRAQRIGVPVVFVNQVGRRGPEKWDGILGKLMSPDTFHLGGLSTIVCSDGKILAQLNDLDEAVIVADVMLDPTKKISTRAQRHGSYGGGFVTPHPFLFEAICYVDSFICGRLYQLSSERRHKAQVAASIGELEPA